MADQCEVVIANPVPLLGLARPVVLVAVELHYELFPWPEGVDLVAGDNAVDGGPRQVGAAHQFEETPLELGAYECRLVVDGQREAQPRDAAPPAAAANQLVDLPQVEEL